MGVRVVIRGTRVSKVQVERRDTQVVAAAAQAQAASRGLVVGREQVEAMGNREQVDTQAIQVGAGRTEQLGKRAYQAGRVTLDLTALKVLRGYQASVEHKARRAYRDSQVRQEYLALVGYREQAGRLVRVGRQGGRDSQE